MRGLRRLVADDIDKSFPFEDYNDLSFNDSPINNLPPQYVQSSRTQGFSAYLMYKPVLGPGDGAIWVALTKTPWNWHYQASRATVADDWTLDDAFDDIGETVIDPDLPEWEGIAPAS